MKPTQLASLGGFLLAALSVAACGQQAASTDDAANLMVISGTSGSVSGNQLTLENVPAVIWFSDRPERAAGHDSVDALVNAWPEGNDSFAADPPNAELSILDGQDTDNAVVELRSVSGDASKLTFEVNLIEGVLPTGDFGPASLFVDACDPAYPGCPPY